MKIKKSIGETFRKITKARGNELMIKKGAGKHATERKNRDRLNRCLSQMTAALTGATTKETPTVILKESSGNLFQTRKSIDAQRIDLKTDKAPKVHVQPRGMKVIFKSLKNLRSRSNIKGCSNKNLPRLPQQEPSRESRDSYTPPINDLRAEPTRKMPQRRLFSRARSNLDNSVLSSRQYSMSTVMCPDTTLYSHPHPVFLESDADISLPRLSSTPLTTKIGSPRFASTPTSDKHASIISRIDHVIESSANQCSKIFETGHSVDLRMALEPLFKESCEAAEGMWRPWL